MTEQKPQPEDRRLNNALNNALENALENVPSPNSDEELKKALISVSNPLALLEMAHDAIIVRDVDGIVQFWNRGSVDLYGWSAEDAIGQPIHALLKTKFPAPEEDIDWALLNVGHWEGELIHSRKDGSRINVSSRQALRRTEDGKPVFILEINRDVTHNAYLKLLQEAAVAASEARTVEEAVRACMTSICVHTGWCVGRACLITPVQDGDAACEDIWHVSEEKRFDYFRDFLRKTPLTLEEGLAGRVLRACKPVWITNVHKDLYLSTGGVARDAGIQSAFGLPVLARSEVIAIIEIFSETAMEMNEHFVDVLASVARQLGRVFERVSAEEAQRRLSVSLLRSQDDERRRIARELHDSAGQYLAGVRMCLEGALKAADTPPAVLERLNDAASITKKCESEVRTLSYLLHPPLLEELGLPSATNWFVQGFAARSGVSVKVDVAPELKRMDNAVELTLFRVLQECLTNIHRHSGSATATVKLAADAEHAHLEVRDQGKGIPKRMIESWPLTARTGVGISGMRERLKDLGGSLEISADETGTTVRATVPVSPEQRRD